MHAFPRDSNPPTDNKADLLAAGVRRDDFYIDHGVSGARNSRPQFDRALDALIDGDTLVITTLDRLGRSTQNMLAFADELRSRAGLRVLNLGGDTSAAAQKLETSQASVSELIGRLEHELEHRLFTRGGRRLLPTTAAVELQVHALQSVTSFDSGVEALKSMSSLEGGVCTFGVLRYGAHYDLVQRFHRRYPKVKVRLVGLNSLAVAESVLSGEIEAGLIVLPVAEAGLQVRPLFRDEVFYVSATRSPTRGPVTIEELTESKLVLYDAFAGWQDPTRRQVLERARLKGLKIDPAIEVEHVDTALGLAATGAVDTFVPQATTKAPGFPKNLRAVPFAEPLYDTIALIQREGAYLSPATRKMAQMAARTLLARVAPEQDVQRSLPSGAPAAPSVGS